MVPVLKTFWQQQRAFLSSVMILTAWRWRQQWLLLLVTGLGVLVATTLISSLPLFSSVMVTAGLRSTLRSTPGATRIGATMNLRAISTQGVTEAVKQINMMVEQDLAFYDNGAPASDIQIKVSGWSIGASNTFVDMHGISMSEATPHLQILQGSLPGDQDTSFDVIVTQSAATYLGVKVGSILPLQITITPGRQLGFRSQPNPIQLSLQAHVVGIFRTTNSDPYWNGANFEAQAPGSTLNAPVNVLVSRPALLHLFDTLTASNKTDGISFGASSQVTLAYTLTAAKITGDQASDLVNQLGVLQADAARQGASSNGFRPSFPYISNVTLNGSIFSSFSHPGPLDLFQNQVMLSTISTFLLTAQIACLVLFFVSTTASMLLERQMGEIALLRCRGASGQQIAGSLITQSIVLCLLAGLLGPVLALGTVALVAPHFLATLDQDALNALPQNFPQLLSTVSWYVLGAVFVTLATLIFSLVVALRLDALALRRETARSTRQPLWLRLRLDLVVAILALLSYGYALYAQSTQQLLNVQSQALILTPLNLLVPFLFLLAGILFFLRLFPALLRMSARLSQGMRGLSSPLALAQMERAPHQPMRMALLLGLATAFALFTLVLSASQTQRAQDLASYEAGADFSGFLPASMQSSTDISPGALARATGLYRQVPGVVSASVGYIEQQFLLLNPDSPEETSRPLQLRAVDTSTFAQAAYWSTDESAQPLAGLLSQLAAQRSRALTRDVVPAIVTSSAWQLLHLHAGATFQLLTSSGQVDPVRYVALEEVAHIPPANESLESGMLVDFSTLAAVRAQSHESISLNYAWIQSSDAPVAVAHVRLALDTQPLALSQLMDRRSLAELNAANPLALNLLGILGFGVGAALLLALLANLVLPILSLRTRLTGFAILRALGTSPQQVARLLAWEQGFILVTALALGLLFGLLLAFMAVPSLIFTVLPGLGGNAAITSTDAVYLFQHLTPVRIELPFSLVMALATLVLLCVLALVLMRFLALKPLLGQILRLSED
jgi:ABC-type antimicrobial peptide transport system permease subunit